MTVPAVLTFLVIVILFFFVSWYVISRLDIIRLPGDPVPRVLTIYVLVSTLIVVLTFLYLVRP